jgi:hypothetical protein
MRRTTVALLIALTCASAALGLRQTPRTLPEARPSTERKLARYHELLGFLSTVRHAYLYPDPAGRPRPIDRLYRAQYVLAPTVLHLARGNRLTALEDRHGVTHVIFDYRRADRLDRALEEHRHAAAISGLEVEVLSRAGGVALVVQRRVER